MFVSQEDQAKDQETYRERGAVEVWFAELKERLFKKSGRAMPSS